MRRRDFITLVGGAGSQLAFSYGGEAQQTAKMPRLSDVIMGSPESSEYMVRALTEGLSQLGYENGQNITLRHYYAIPQPEKFQEVLSSLVGDTDFLIVWSTIRTIVAKKLFATVPTVFLAVGDPVRVGAVESLSHPGGNMTGVTYEASTESWAKRIQLLKEILPNLDRIAVLKAAGDANSTYAMASLEPLLPRLGVTLVPIDFSSAEDLDGAFVEISRSQVKGLLVIAGALTFVNGKRIAELALANRLPSAHAFRETVRDGGLIGMGPDLAAIGRQGARLVSKILKGEKPADLPVEQPIRYEVYLNLKTATALGLTIPPTLQGRAEVVIE